MKCQNGTDKRNGRRCARCSAAAVTAKAHLQPCQDARSRVAELLRIILIIRIQPLVMFPRPCFLLLEGDGGGTAGARGARGARAGNNREFKFKLSGVVTCYFVRVGWTGKGEFGPLRIPKLGFHRMQKKYTQGMGCVLYTQVTIFKKKFRHQYSVQGRK